jgi:hypothetical protein
MDKRTCERIAVRITVRFYSCDEGYSGTAINISKKGMYILIRNMPFPVEQEFNISFPVEKKVVQLPAAIKRIIKSPDSYDGLGVELLNPSQDYLSFIKHLSSKPS